MMPTKRYKIDPAKMGLLPYTTIEFWLDFDDMDFVWGYSEALFASLCEREPYLASLFSTRLKKMAAAIDYRADQDFSRPGCFVVFDDKTWLTKLAAVATQGAARFAVPVPTSIASPRELTREIAARNQVFIAPAPGGVQGPSRELTVLGSPAKHPALYLPAVNIGQFMLPTVFARSGLFGADGPCGSRKSYTSQSPRVIQHFSGVRAGQTTFSYTGDELWTSDEEVWTTLLAEAVTTPLGEDVSMRILDLLHAMPGRGVDGTSPRKRVRAAGVRLATASLTITTSDPAAISMIKHCLPDNPAVRDAEKKNFLVFTVKLLEQFTASTNMITFRVSRELRALFGDKLHTWYDREAYYALPAEGLSRRLFLLYNSHYNCQPLTQAELSEYLGIKSKTARHVRAVLEEAHAEMQRQGLILGHAFRKPTDGERKNCTTACFVVDRPARPAKLSLAEIEVA